MPCKIAIEAQKGTKFERLNKKGVIIATYYIKHKKWRKKEDMCKVKKSEKGVALTTKLIKEKVFDEVKLAATYQNTNSEWYIKGLEFALNIATRGESISFPDIPNSTKRDFEEDFDFIEISDEQKEEYLRNLITEILFTNENIKALTGRTDAMLDYVEQYLKLKYEKVTGRKFN